VGWLACVVYSTSPSFWLAVHARADFWRARPRSPYCLLLPLWIAMWIVVALITAPWRHIMLYRTPWSWLPAVLLAAAGVGLYSRSFKGFSARQLGGIPEVLAGSQEQRLVTTGIRSRVRHPVYLGHFCQMVAWSLGTGLAVCYGLTAFALITGAIMIRMEDRELERRFGAEYAAYRQRVPAVWPTLGR
jgi:protein-S-isoprenylcysteine O-methyltransferase Ste14